MYCRTCGSKMNDNAEICVKCGVRRNVGTDYCQVCGARTTSAMNNCRNCGAKLMKAMSTAQVKKTAVSKGKKTLGTVLLVIGIILLIAAVINLGVGITSRSYYNTVSHLGAVGRCAILGGLFTGFGRKFRNKKIGDICMKRYLKSLLSIILLFSLILSNTLSVNAAEKVTHVYASTEKEFYQYVNEFMKGSYKELIIHVPKNKFKIDEYKQGINTHNTVANVLSSFNFEIMGQYDNGDYEYRLYYFLDDGQTKAKKLEKKANQIIKKIIKPNMTDEQKITAITTYMNKHCKYVSDEYCEYINCISNKKISTLERMQKYSYLFSAYGVLCQGKSTCDGYSRAFNLLARKAGIPSIQVISNNHAWNIYKIDNKYYKIDTTKQQTKGTLLTNDIDFIEKDIYKDLLKYVVTGTKKVKMTPYTPPENNDEDYDDED